MATRELLQAVERAGSTNNAMVIRALEGHKMPAAERMQHFDAHIDPVTHQVQQTIYLARRNAKPADPTDLYEILSQTQPANALDDAAYASLAGMINGQYSPVVIPLPGQGADPRRRWHEGMPSELLGHPLCWLGDRLVCFGDPETGEPETPDEMALRIAVEMTERGLYDSESGTWLDLLRLNGINIDLPEERAQVEAWMSGVASHPILDTLDLPPLPAGHPCEEVERSGVDWAYVVARNLYGMQEVGALAADWRYLAESCLVWADDGDLPLDELSEVATDLAGIGAGLSDPDSADERWWMDREIEVVQDRMRCDAAAIRELLLVMADRAHEQYQVVDGLVDDMVDDLAAGA